MRRCVRAAGGHAEVVAALLSPERAPAVPRPDAHGRTALHFAAQSEGVTRALLAAGASWRARDVHGQTAEGEAKKRGCAAVEALLHEAWVKEVEESKEEEVVVKKVEDKVKKGGATPPVSPLGARAPRPAHRKAVVAKASRRVAEVAEVEEVEVEGGDEGGGEGEGEAGGAAAEGGVRRECTPMASARLSWLSDGDSPPDAGGGWVEVTQRGRARGRAAAAPREVADAVASPTAAASTATDTAPTRGKVEKGGSEEEAFVCAEPRGGGEGGGEGGGDAAAAEVVDSEAAAPEAVAVEASAAMASAAGAEAWAALLVEAPEMGALDLQLAHVLGQRLGELSMAQITAVQAVQRDVALRLEDARVELARRLERETVEARLQIEIEKAAREARWRPPAA